MAVAFARCHAAWMNAAWIGFLSLRTEFRLGFPKADHLSSKRVGQRSPSIRIMWVQLNGSAQQRFCAL